MAGLAVRPSSPTSVRYSDADKEAAYWVWRTTGGRSYRRTAAIVNVDRETVSRWANDDDWHARANREDAEDIGSIRHAVAAVITHELVPNIETAIEIRDNKENSARDRLAAVQWLSGLAGIAPVSRIETAIKPTDATTIDVDDLRQLRPDQLVERERDYRKQRGS